MAFQSQAEIDEALRTGTVLQAEIEAFNESQAVSLAKAIEESDRLAAEEVRKAFEDAEAFRVAQEQAAAAIALAAKPIESVEDIAAKVYDNAFTQFEGQRKEADLTVEEMAALEQSYQDDVADFVVKPGDTDPGFVEEKDGLTEIENGTAADDQAAAPDAVAVAATDSPAT